MTLLFTISNPISLEHNAFRLAEKVARYLIIELCKMAIFIYPELHKQYRDWMGFVSMGNYHSESKLTDISSKIFTYLFFLIYLFLLKKEPL